MNFDNLIYHHEDFKGATIKDVRGYGGGVVLTTEDNRFCIVMPADDEDGCMYINILGPSKVFRTLRTNQSITYFLKEAGVLDFKEFERLVTEEFQKEKAASELQQIEREKKLLAELKAKYES
jgi:hypothetical protein